MLAITSSFQALAIARHHLKSLKYLKFTLCSRVHSNRQTIFTTVLLGKRWVIITTETDKYCRNIIQITDINIVLLCDMLY